ncbi:hypothetical protein FI667_g6508, partial [Globisporangium splendens]
MAPTFSLHGGDSRRFSLMHPHSPPKTPAEEEADAATVVRPAVETSLSAQTPFEAPQRRRSSIAPSEDESTSLSYREDPPEDFLSTTIANLDSTASQVGDHSHTLDSTAPPPCIRNHNYQRKSSLDRESIEGYMVMHVKKPRRTRMPQFHLARAPSFFVVADAKKHVLEVYSNETKSELIYLLSLTNAVLNFESDDANMVMEKCFCIEVKTWKKRNTVTFKHQCFVFFEDNQVRMLLWVKCIHLAIKKASSSSVLGGMLHDDHRAFFRSSAASNTSDVSDDDAEQQYVYEHHHHHHDGERDSENTASGFTGDGHESLGDHRGSGSGRESATSVRERLAIDPNAAVRGAPPSGQKEPKTPFNRLNAMFSHHKSPKAAASGGDNAKESSKTGAAAAAAALLSPKKLHLPTSSSSSSTSTLKNQFHTRSSTLKPNATGTSTPTVFGSSQEAMQARKRDEELQYLNGGRGGYSMSSSNASSTSPHHDGVSEDVTSSRLREYTIPPKVQRHIVPDAKPERVTARQTLDNKIMFVLHRCVVLWVAFVGGILEASIFLPIAAAGIFKHVCPQPEGDGDGSEFLVDDRCHRRVPCESYAGLAGHRHHLHVAVLVVLRRVQEPAPETPTSHRRQTSLRRRALRHQQLRSRRCIVPHASSLAVERLSMLTPCCAVVCLVQIPNWICHPDVDRIEWLNKVLVTYVASILLEAFAVTTI